jgi:hypothetical protein
MKHILLLLFTLFFSLPSFAGNSKISFPPWAAKAEKQKIEYLTILTIAGSCSIQLVDVRMNRSVEDQDCGGNGRFVGDERFMYIFESYYKKSGLPTRHFNLFYFDYALKYGGNSIFDFADAFMEYIPKI